MEFIETSTFQKCCKDLLGEEELHKLQTVLSIDPAIGRVIPGAGGLRKVRWVSLGRGKRGGLRIIYYWLTQNHKIFLLHVYQKSKQENLGLDQLKYLRLLIEDQQDE